MMKTNISIGALAFLLLSSFAVAQSTGPAKKAVGAGKPPSTQVEATQPTTLIKSVPPTYPQEAKEQGIQGSVRLHVLIGTDGAVKEVSVVSGPPSLTKAAVDAVRQWRYKPYLLNGKPVEVDTTVVVNFNLTVEEPLAWWVVVTEVAKGTPSSQIIAELKERSVDFPYDTPLDALHEKLVRSLGASDEVIDAARHAQVYPAHQLSDSERKLLSTAETDVRNLIAKSTENAALHELLAMIFWEEEAGRDNWTTEIRRAVLLAPDSPSAHHYLGMFLMAWSDRTPQMEQEAVFNLRESLRLLPGQFESHMRLGFVLQTKKDWDGAMAEFQKALENTQFPSNRSYFQERIGDAYLTQRKYDLAESAYREALDQAAEKAHLHLSIGVAAYKKGDYRDALVEFRKYMWLSKSPNKALGRSWLTGTLYQLRQYSESMSQAKAALAADPNDKTAKSWLDQATAKVQSGAEGPQTVVVQVNTGGGGGGGLAGTIWACTDVLNGNATSFQWIFDADGHLQGDSNDTWEQSGSQFDFRDPSGSVYLTGTVSGNSIHGQTDQPNDSVTCTLQSGAVQSNSASAVNVGPPASYFTAPTIQSSGSTSNTTGGGSGHGSTAGNPADSDSASAKRQNDPGGSQADGNDYTDTASQCGHPQIEANTLYIVNECSFVVDATYTSKGDIWGEMPLGPGEHGRTAYSAAAVNNVGGVTVYTCPGSGTAVDPAGNPIGLPTHYTAREYKCHR